MTTKAETAKKSFDDGTKEKEDLVKAIATLKTALDAADVASKAAECSESADEKAKAAENKKIFDALAPAGYSKDPEKVDSVPIPNKWVKAAAAERKRK